MRNFLPGCYGTADEQSGRRDRPAKLRARRAAPRPPAVTVDFEGAMPVPEPRGRRLLRVVRALGDAQDSQRRARSGRGPRSGRGGLSAGPVVAVRQSLGRAPGHRQRRVPAPHRPAELSQRLAARGGKGLFDAVSGRLRRLAEPAPPAGAAGEWRHGRAAAPASSNRPNTADPLPDISARTAPRGAQRRHQPRRSRDAGPPPPARSRCGTTARQLEPTPRPRAGGSNGQRRRDAIRPRLGHPAIGVAVDTPNGGRTIAHASRGSGGSGAISSPRPSPSAVPPHAKNGTSDPRRTPTRASRSRSASTRQTSHSSRSAAIASALPPPSPAWVGTCLSSVTSRPAGSGRPSSEASARAARNTRFVSSSGASRPGHRSVERPVVLDDGQRVGRAIDWKTVVSA